MELSQLRGFLAVAKTQHVTRAAQDLHVAQPALSQSIHRLEKELQVPLFAAKGRNIVLTEYGRFLQSQLEPLLTTLDAIPNELSIMANLENATIHLNVLAASTLVTQAIIEYKRLNHNVHFQLLQNKEAKLFDIEVTTTFFSKKVETLLSNQFVCTERIFLAVPNDSRFCKRKTIALSEVKNESFISLAGSKQLRTICDSFCTQAGFQPNIVFESDNPTAVKNMIAANIGIGFWPEFTWGTLSNDDILLLPIEAPLCKRDLLLTYHNNKAQNKEVETFFHFLTDYILVRKTLS
ncbi:MAG: LysR family transcriptional regulator [Lachnospiraceae bacterium]